MLTSRSKVFGIGLSKTGTTSLAQALQILGYRTKDNMGVTKYAAGDLSCLDLSMVEVFDALTDTPIPSFYRELDAKFPGSKFILTVRDSPGWLTSCRKQFTQRLAEKQTDAHRRLFVDLYGTEVFDEALFANGYERFVKGVNDYFKDRQHDLLAINVTDGEGWDKLCPFLGRPEPDVIFPKANVTRITWMSIEDLIAVALDGGEELMRHFNHGRGTDFGAAGNEHRRASVAKRLLERSMQVVRSEHVHQTAIRAANKAILRGLVKLNPEIPVVSRAERIVPHADRKRWNHLWLVDPLDGEEAYISGADDFSINIALIENGHPTYGIVCAPARDTIYYGSIGKGAYRRKRGELATPLSPGLDGPPATADVPETPAALASSCALSMCALCERPPSGETVFEASPEWRTAASHAILNSAGREVRECESGRELGYNKSELVSARFKVA